MKKIYIRKRALVLCRVIIIILRYKALTIKI